MADQMVLLFNNITALKTKCVSFYQSFEPAGRIMDALAQQSQIERPVGAAGRGAGMDTGMGAGMGGGGGGRVGMDGESKLHSGEDRGSGGEARSRFGGEQGGGGGVEGGLGENTMRGGGDRSGFEEIPPVEPLHPSPATLRVPSLRVASTISRQNDAREITFQNVWFSYPSNPDVPILRGASFTIKAGSAVALVGRSGSGKSTSLALIERFYDPTRGQVLFDGQVHNI